MSEDELPTNPDTIPPTTADVMHALAEMRTFFANSVSSIHSAVDGLKELVTTAMQNEASNLVQFRDSVTRDVSVIQERVVVLERMSGVMKPPNGAFGDGAPPLTGTGE